ncbi:MAG: carbohydrate porin, partial [Burkholderiales bacterium]
CAFAAPGAARAEDAKESLTERSSLLDVPNGPKDFLRHYGISTDIWVTQIYQGLATGEGSKTWRDGGKVDGFLKIDGEKLGLWQGFSFSAQYEHYFGSDVNGFAGTLLPVNTALAFLHTGGFHSALSLNVTQQFDERFSISVGKFNMITAASRTPLLGGGGIDTFMNLGLAAPITGVTPPYIIGGMATLKTEPAAFTLMLYDPRNAQIPRVIERPFEKGVTAALSAMIPTEIAGLRGYHTLRGTYSNLRGLDLDDIPQLRLPQQAREIDKKQGYRYFSYSLQQNLVQSESNPAAGWGLFTQVSTSDGNPNPLKWVVIAGLAGNTLLPGREDDRWG